MAARRQAAVVAFLVLVSGTDSWRIRAPASSRRRTPSCIHTAQAAAKAPSAAAYVGSHRGHTSLRHRRFGVFSDELYARDREMAMSQLRLSAGSPSDTMMESNQLPVQDDDRGEDARPFAKVGDIVQYQGKWRDEIVFGEIRQLKRVDQTGEWRAYVLALDEIGDGQYSRKKSRKSKAEPLTSLRPVRAFYVRSINGFKIMTNSETGEPRYLSDGYELENFELPIVEVDPVKFRADLESYEDLKRRLVLDTASFGAVSALAAWQILGVDQAVLVALGALAAVGYVLLLEKTADDVASGNRDTLTKLQGDVRFVIPVALVGTVALKNYLMHPDATKLLNLIPKQDFAAVMFGFVAPSRLPLLYREIRASLTGDDILDMLPGSIGQGRQILKGMRSSDRQGSKVEETTGTAGVTRIVVVSGPKNLGKSSLVDAIMREDNRLAMPVWCTTRPLKETEVEGESFVFVGQVKFEDIERNAGFLHTYRDENGESYGLRLQDVRAVAERGKVCVVDADRPLVQALMRVGDVALIGVWVSVSSMGALESRIRSTLIENGAADDENLDSNVRAMTREAVDDIEFGVSSGVFDFTVINNRDVNESMTTLRRAVQFAAS